MQGADLSNKLIELEKAYFIRRTSYNADQGIARAYILDERLWPDYRRLEMQKFETIM